VGLVTWIDCAVSTIPPFDCDQVEGVQMCYPSPDRPVGAIEAMGEQTIPRMAALRGAPPNER